MFTWQAPPAGSGPVHLYWALNSGNNNGNSAGDYIYADMATSNEGSSAVHPTNSSSPDSPVLTHTYPNPFNPTTAISYKLQAASFVNLTVYDSEGCKVAELVNGWRNVGQHEVTFDGSELASGVYVYQLEASPSSGSGPEGGLCSATPTILTGKMVLLK